MNTENPFLMETTIIPKTERPFAERSTLYDPELLYVECAFCGRPVVWDKGEASEFVAWLGVNGWSLDSSYLILTYGCVHCLPEAEAYRVQMVRVGQGEDDGIPNC